MVAWNAARKAAVVGISAIVAHHEIAVFGNLIGRVHFVRLARASRVIFGQLLAINPHGPIVDVQSLSRQADNTLDDVRRFLRDDRSENHHLLPLRIPPQAAHASS